VGATNRAGLAFNGCRFGGSHKRRNHTKIHTQRASGLDGCCGGHMGVHGMDYSEDAYKTLKLAGQNTRTSSGFVMEINNDINKRALLTIKTPTTAINGT
jgi:hypothetical protein